MAESKYGAGPVWIATYLSELLGVDRSTVYNLKITGVLTSYSAEDVRHFLNEHPVHLQRAMARRRGLTKPKYALPAEPWKTRSKMKRRLTSRTS